MSCQ